jgi:hypothetical protein
LIITDDTIDALLLDDRQRVLGRRLARDLDGVAPVFELWGEGLREGGVVVDVEDAYLPTLHHGRLSPGDSHYWTYMTDPPV